MYLNNDPRTRADTITTASPSKTCKRTLKWDGLVYTPTAGSPCGADATRASPMKRMRKNPTTVTTRRST
jgi:hypothetical protein